MNRRLFAGAVAAYLYNGWIGRFPSRRLRCWYLRRWLGNMGQRAGVQLGCRFLNGRNVHLGEGAVINFGSLLDGRKHAVEIGHDASIGPEAALLTLGHDPQAADFADRGGVVRIGPRVWIGYRAIVLPGVTIGEGAVVAAGAVVTRDIDPFSICAGSPARPVGERSREINYELHYSPWLL
ncbi:MAG: acetyltransferase [Verrucomicrobia bacterium]|jgi:maltose O-acetyltransferase|nr:acetyltransferase [Verrucomicrobiota bacterium]